MPPLAVELIRQWFSSGISQCVIPNVNPDILEVLGIQTGTISAVKDIFSSFLSDSAEAIRSWQLPDLNSPYLTDKSFLDALTITICSMKVDDKYP